MTGFEPKNAGTDITIVNMEKERESVSIRDRMTLMVYSTEKNPRLAADEESPPVEGAELDVVVADVVEGVAPNVINIQLYRTSVHV